MPRRRYMVRSMKTAAGTFITAAAIATMSVLGTPVAGAAVTAPMAAQAPAAGPAAGSAMARRDRGRQERMEGVWSDLNRAVDFGDITSEQASRFAAQIENRIARGL